MTRRELAELICKTIALILFAIAGFYVCANVLYIFSLFFMRQTSFQMTVESLIIHIPILGLIGMGVLYWWKADVIATRMFQDDDTETIQSRIYIHEIMVAIFSATGVVLFVTAIKEIIPILMTIQYYELSPSDMIFSPGFISYSVQIIFSFWLILGSRGIVKGINLLRDKLIQFESDPIDTICRTCGERYLKERSHCPLCGNFNQGGVHEEKTERPL